jgi:hypothetical protein
MEGIMTTGCKKKYYSVLTLEDLEEADLKELPTKGTTLNTYLQNVKAMRDSLYELLDLKFSKEELQSMSDEVKWETYGARIEDYAVTEEAWSKFREFHKDLFKQMSKRNEIGMFALQQFPDIIDENGLIVCDIV